MRHEARRGTTRPILREPPIDANCPVIHGNTAPPNPLTAKTHLDSDGRLVMAKTRERHRGKIGASIRPANVALMRPVAEVKLSSRSTLLARRSESDIVNNFDSVIFFKMAGAAVLPNKSAIQKNDVAVGAITAAEKGKR